MICKGMIQWQICFIIDYRLLILAETNTFQNILSNVQDMARPFQFIIYDNTEKICFC